MLIFPARTRGTQRFEGDTQCSSELGYRAVKTHNCSWTLQNVSSFAGDENCYSKAFNLDNLVIQWEMQCRWHYFNFILRYKQSGSENRGARVSIKADILNSNGDIIEKIRNGEWIKMCGKKDSFQLDIGRHHLLQDLKDDTIVIRFNLINEFPDVISEEELTEKMSKNIISGASKLIQDFGSLYKTEKMADAVVVVEDAKIQVHTVVLAARSKVFAAMFENEFLEGQTRRIEISDFSAENIKCVLEFLYCGSVEDLDVDKALDLLRAADKYDVLDLTTYCCKFLRGHINEETVIPIIVSADMFSIVDLKESAFDYLITNKSSVSIDEHKSLFDTRPSVLFEIINRLQKL